MRFIPLFCLTVFCSMALAQEGYPPAFLSIESDEKNIGQIKNTSCFPVTVSVNEKDFFVPAKDQKSIEANKWGKWQWIPGKIGKMDELSLVSPLKEKQVADFGANSGETHTKEYEFSYDFSVPEGTNVHAMESGVVIRVIDHYTEAHQDKKRMGEVNKVEILHADGSTAAYVHLAPKSAKVKICDNVEKGQLIALSGNTGFSSGAHLHVDVIRPVGAGKFKTIPVKFKF